MRSSRPGECPRARHFIGIISEISDLTSVYSSEKRDLDSLMVYTTEPTLSILKYTLRG